MPQWMSWAARFRRSTSFCCPTVRRSTSEARRRDQWPAAALGSNAIDPAEQHEALDPVGNAKRRCCPGQGRTISSSWWISNVLLMKK